MPAGSKPFDRRGGFGAGPRWRRFLIDGHTRPALSSRKGALVPPSRRARGSTPHENGLGARRGPRRDDTMVLLRWLTPDL